MGLQDLAKWSCRGGGGSSRGELVGAVKVCTVSRRTNVVWLGKGLREKEQGVVLKW